MIPAVVAARTCSNSLLSHTAPLDRKYAHQNNSIKRCVQTAMLVGDWQGIPVQLMRQVAEHVASALALSSRVRAGFRRQRFLHSRLRSLHSCVRCGRCKRRTAARQRLPDGKLAHEIVIDVVHVWRYLLRRPHTHSSLRHSKLMGLKRAEDCRRWLDLVIVCICRVCKSRDISSTSRSRRLNIFSRFLHSCPRLRQLEMMIPVCDNIVAWGLSKLLSVERLTALERLPLSSPRRIPRRFSPRP